MVFIGTFSFPVFSFLEEWVSKVLFFLGIIKGAFRDEATQKDMEGDGKGIRGFFNVI